MDVTTFFPPCGESDGIKPVVVGAKGTEAAGASDDAIKALPGPRQIEASWGASTYNKGCLMTGVEHVFYRHGPGSGFSNVSKFSQGNLSRMFRAM